jgi:hypothetical protein
VRLAHRCVVIEDHTRTGLLAAPLLRFMDDVGNRRFGVRRVHDFWTGTRWREAFEPLGLRIESWSGRLGLYPVPLDWVFGRSLHFVARLAVPGAA